MRNVWKYKPDGHEMIKRGKSNMHDAMCEFAALGITAPGGSVVTVVVAVDSGAPVVTEVACAAGNKVEADLSVVC